MLMPVDRGVADGRSGIGTAFAIFLMAMPGLLGLGLGTPAAYLRPVLSEERNGRAS
ncbi:hypothetical protein V8J82_18810 [Gymnodinialimonas sp. 2305UL16-5]|uniref:hypothetical protein n=1 Tax=Gymnodinialimonas mytili TaxID=3126503 RepID=UPI003094F3C9